MQPTLNIALRAARIASEQIARAIERLDIIKSEQQSVSDYIKETALAAEKTACYHIHKANPSHKIVGQYGGVYETAESQGNIEWHISPIDGLTNFANGLPLFALTLVCKEKGRNEHAVIINPITGEEFTASRGRGAQLNGKRIRVSDLKTLKSALVGSDFVNDNQPPHLDAYLSLYRAISQEQAQIQSYGSAALTLAYVAAGRIDACCLMTLDSWEINPGMLIIQEAGGLMGDFIGGNNSVNSGNLVSANPRLFKNLLQTIRPALSKELKA
ncbi:MAG: inositol monophosphatase [Motiliproteus sp.]|nr:inositol monophosphatase [Motiliproteus sp.]MCW9053205.1 inositol monophosphatase [Motiliproteus sp.]